MNCERVNNVNVRRVNISHCLLKKSECLCEVLLSKESLSLSTLEALGSTLSESLTFDKSVCYSRNRVVNR